MISDFWCSSNLGFRWLKSSSRQTTDFKKVEETAPALAGQSRFKKISCEDRSFTSEVAKLLNQALIFSVFRQNWIKRHLTWQQCVALTAVPCLAVNCVWRAIAVWENCENERGKSQNSTRRICQNDSNRPFMVTETRPVSSECISLTASFLPFCVSVATYFLSLSVSFPFFLSLFVVQRLSSSDIAFILCDPAWVYWNSSDQISFSSPALASQAFSREKYIRLVQKNSSFF